MNEQNPNPERSLEELAESIYAILKRAGDILEEMTFHVQWRRINPEAIKSALSGWQGRPEFTSYPLVSDGADAIRAHYNSSRGLIISFTNDLEDPEDPRRLEVVARFKAENIPVVDFSNGSQR